MSDISQSVLNFVQNFEKTFQNDKMFIFEKFEYDDFTLEEQKYIFDNLKTKQKCQLYNTISVDVRNAYCKYLNEEEPIGLYGVEWMKNMEKNYPETVDYLRLQHKFLTIARAVNQEADQYRDLLDEQYEQMNPRPTNFEDVLKWERARMYYSEGTVMREKVLVLRTD